MNDIQQAAQAFEEHLKTELQAAPFPDFPEELRGYIPDAMVHESLATLGCGLETYKDVVAGKTDLYTTSFIINALQARTPAEMRMSLERYHAFQDLVADTAAKWNGYVQPMKEKLGRRMQAQHTINQGVPAHKKIHLPGR